MLKVVFLYISLCYVCQRLFVFRLIDFRVHIVLLDTFVSSVYLG